MSAGPGMVTIVCDHPACGTIHRRGMTESQLKAAADRSFRNLPPCPKCGRRFNYRLASSTEVESASMVSS